MHLFRGTKTERWEKWAVKGSRRFCREARKYHLIDKLSKIGKKKMGEAKKGKTEGKEARGRKRERKREKLRRGQTRKQKGRDRGVEEKEQTKDVRPCL